MIEVFGKKHGSKFGCAHADMKSRWRRVVKRGIEVWTEYDELGRWTLVIEKKRGKLTLEDIMRTARI